MKKAIKKTLAVLFASVMTVGVLAGCSGGTTTDSASGGSAESSSSGGKITVISREDGSGTRGAFVELFGVEEEVDGQKMDMTVDTADITNSTSVMMTSVADNVNAIGYISLGSMNDTIKALNIDGAEATADNIKNGTYKVSRPFNIVTKDGLSEVAQDFIAFILSDEGQAVVEENNYISESSTGPYAGTSPAGSITVSGSSSVTPVMEKLKEAYAAVNPNAEIEIQQSDSTTGVNGAIEGICDIGMASRELKDSETSQGVTAQVIALDGIAVIVNNDNPVSEATSDQIKQIYTGEITDWSELSSDSAE
ncbi:MAG TPA: substrate-binding domain-containing protein [Firmicutes bacterium]|nr:substrate-binding domain-containing protein [Bacillota bacterium]